MTERRILIADDEPYLIRSLSYILRKEGYQVDTAMDGLEALEMVRRLKPRLLFLDLQLPKIDGFEVCRQIKSDPQLQKTYIILLTAKGQDEDRRRGLAAGADEYLKKPYSPKEVVMHLQDLFRT